MKEINQITNDLKRHEGFRPHVYQDHLGYWTIGYGRMVDKSKGGGISKEEAEYLLANDISEVTAALNKTIDGFVMMPRGVRRALINMAFQMGVNGVLKFKKTIFLLEAHQYEQAATEALNSKWARQTPGRAEEVTSWMKEY